MEKLQEKINFLKERKVYLYGAGSYGRMLLEALQINGIEAAGFIDRYAKKIQKIENLNVYEPAYLKQLKKEECVIILATNLLSVADSMERDVINLNSELYIMKEGFLLGRELRIPHCKKKLMDGIEFDIGDCVSCGSEDHDCEICIEYLKKISKPDLNIYGSKKYDRIGYIMGQFCSLKCKYCFEGVPRIQHGIFTEAETILKDVQKFANGCYFLKYVELIGGEPFLHPEFKNILKGLLALRNIGYIQIFTNATIVPDEELIQILKSPRIIIQVSDYYDFVDEQKKQKIKKTKELLVSNGIYYKFIANGSWLDMNCFEELEKSEEEVKRCILSCGLSKCHRLFQGRLYKCPHQYTGVQQGKLQLFEGEYVDIHKYSDEELAKQLESLKMITYLDACKHCAIIDKAIVVPPGEQI